MKSAPPGNDSALEHALRCLEGTLPNETRRARRALDVLLQGLRASSWPGAAWLFSELTPDGFPIELTFSSRPEPAVRYAVEIAGPEMHEQQRLLEAFRLFHRLTGHLASSETEQIMSSLQEGHELAYGAWFGGAHTKDRDRYKIYAEVAKGACVEGFFPGAPARGVPLDHCQAEPVMLGYQPESDTRELYFRTAKLMPEDVGRLLWKNNLSHRYQETMNLMRAVAGRPATSALAGFSLAWNGTATEKAISLYTEPRFLFGSDANVRRAMLRLAQTYCWPLPGYEQVTYSHRNCEDSYGNQGVIAWIISAANPVELRISVRPPDPAECAEIEKPSYAGAAGYKEQIPFSPDRDEEKKCLSLIDCNGPGRMLS